MLKLAKLSVLILCCLMLSGCVAPLLAVPVVGGLMVLLAGFFMLLGSVLHDNSFVYLILVTVVLWIACIDKLAKVLSKNLDDYGQNMNAFKLAFLQSFFSGLSVVFVLAVMGEFGWSFIKAALGFTFTFLYVFLIVFFANNIEQSIEELSSKIDGVAEKFKDKQQYLTGIDDYGEDLKGLNKVQGWGYVSFLLPPLVFIPVSLVGFSFDFTIMQLLGMGSILFGAFGIGYVIWRSIGLSNKNDFSFDEAVAFDEVIEFYAAIYQSRSIILMDRLHTVVVSIASLCLGYALVLKDTVNWLQLGVVCAVTAGLIVLIFCWAPFYVHQNGSKSSLVNQIRLGGTTSITELEEVRSKLDGLYPSIPRTDAVASVMSVLTLSGGVSLLSTIARALSS